MDELGNPCVSLRLLDLFVVLTKRALTVDPVLEMLNEAPAKMERTIASIEKQSRALEKEVASASADVTELTLKDLLSKLK